MTDIRSVVDSLFDEKKHIQTKIENIQGGCPHVTSVYSAHGSSGNWDDPEGYYWYQFHCYDCRKGWSGEQKNGYGKAMKVDKIDPNENPEVVELQIRIAKLQGKLK